MPTADPPSLGISQFAVLRMSPFDLLIQQTIYYCRLAGLPCTSAAALIAIGFSSIAVTAIAVCGVSQRSAEMQSAFDGSVRASYFRSRIGSHLLRADVDLLGASVVTDLPSGHSYCR